MTCWMMMCDHVIFSKSLKGFGAKCLFGAGHEFLANLVKC